MCLLRLSVRIAKKLLAVRGGYIMPIFLGSQMESSGQ